jgi:hypothetical protein
MKRAVASRTGCTPHPRPLLSEERENSLPAVGCYHRRDPHPGAGVEGKEEKQNITHSLLGRRKR